MEKELINKSRTRIEFAKTAPMRMIELHRKTYGGWIVKHESGKSYWYENSYTRTEIFKDLPGALEII